jgi:esterase/lipase
MDLRFAHNALWIDEPSKGPAQAVVLMLHGLNLKPGRMDGWAQLLSTHQAQVRRIALYGHSGDPAHMAQADPLIWRKQFDEAIHEAYGFAQKNKIPLYFVGFSLGALVALEWLAGHNMHNIHIDKMVLIAPALATPWYSRAALGLSSLFKKSLMLPSRSPKSYRANEGTSVAAYEALFSLKKSLEKAHFKNTNISTLIFIDKHDELVPSARIKNIIKKYNLGQWTLVIVDNKFAANHYGFRHLMVDPESMGSPLWEDLSQQVLSYFKLEESYEKTHQ